MRIYKEFTFEAAHFLPFAAPGHPNARIHGHSFRCRVTVEGSPDPETGLILNFNDLEAAINECRKVLDHQFLNNIEGLSPPTLECISTWIWNRLANKVPGLAEVHLWRPTCGEGCLYSGSA